MPNRSRGRRLTDTEALGLLSELRKDNKPRSVTYAWVTRHDVGKSYLSILTKPEERFVWTFDEDAFQRLIDGKVILPSNYELFDKDAHSDLSAREILRHGSADPEGDHNLRRFFTPHGFTRSCNEIPKGVACGFLTVHRRAQKNLTLSFSDWGDRIHGRHILHFVHHHLALEPART